MTSHNNGELDHLIETGFEVAVEVEPSAQRSHSYAEELEAYKKETRFLRTRAIVWGTLTALFVLGLVFVFHFQEQLARWSWSGNLPKNPDQAAAKILSISPVIVRFPTLATK